MTPSKHAWFDELLPAFDGLFMAAEAVADFADMANWAAATARSAADQSLDSDGRERLTRLADEYQHLHDEALAVHDSLDHVGGQELMSLLGEARDLEAAD